MDLGLGDEPACLDAETDQEVGRADVHGVPLGESADPLTRRGNETRHARYGDAS